MNFVGKSVLFELHNPLEIIAPIFFYVKVSAARTLENAFRIEGVWVVGWCPTPKRLGTTLELMENLEDCAQSLFPECFPEYFATRLVGGKLHPPAG